MMMVAAAVLVVVLSAAAVAYAQTVTSPAPPASNAPQPHVCAHRRQRRAAL